MGAPPSHLLPSCPSALPSALLAPEDSLGSCQTTSWAARLGLGGGQLGGEVSWSQNLVVKKWT